jgi:hypothetical protein
MGAAVVLVAGRYAGAFLLALPGPVAGVTGPGMKGKKSLFPVTPSFARPWNMTTGITFLHHQ